VQGTLRLFFETFRRTGSGMATVKAFRQQRLKFPRRARSGPQRGEGLWDDLEHARAPQRTNGRHRGIPAEPTPVR
jgi:hypothetical protein